MHDPQVQAQNPRQKPSLRADPAAQFPAPMQGPVAVRDVTLVPMTYNGVVEHQSLLIEQGRIQQIGAFESLAMAHGTNVLDGGGMFLTPGLWDMHAHYGDPGQAILFLANGVTGVRNMWGGRFHLDVIERVSAGVLPGPVVYTTSPIVDAPVAEGRGVYPGTILLDDPGDATAIVERFAAAGYHAVKAYSYLSAECFAALCRAAAAAGLKVVGHCPTTLSFEQAIAAGMSSFEHLLEIGRGHLRDGARLDSLNPHGDGILARFETEVDHLDEDAVRELAGLMAARDVWNCPTLTVSDRLFRRSVRANQDDPAMRYMPTATREQWARRAALAQSDADPHAVDIRRRYVDMLVRVTGLLAAEGAPLLVGTDAGSPMTPQGFTIHEELAHFIEAGITAYDALSAATVNAARFTGLEADYGTIEAGKRADLVLVSANPLDDLSALREPAAVVSNGYLFNRSDLDRLLKWRIDTADAALELPPELLGPMATRQWWAR